MTNALQQRNLVGVEIVWWISRVLSCLVLLTMGGFMLSYFIGGAELAPRDLTAADRIGVAALGLSLFGLLVAWKWEHVGVAITIAAFVVGAALNLQVVTSPLVLVPICAGLILFSGWLRRNSTANGVNAVREMSELAAEQTPNRIADEQNGELEPPKTRVPKS